MATTPSVITPTASPIKVRGATNTNECAANQPSKYLSVYESADRDQKSFPKFIESLNAERYSYNGSKADQAKSHLAETKYCQPVEMNNYSTEFDDDDDEDEPVWKRRESFEEERKRLVRATLNKTLQYQRNGINSHFHTELQYENPYMMSGPVSSRQPDRRPLCGETSLHAKSRSKKGDCSKPKSKYKDANDTPDSNAEACACAKTQTLLARKKIIVEWQTIATIMDRFLFWLFLMGTVVAYIVILVVVPSEKPIAYDEESKLVMALRMRQDV